MPRVAFRSVLLLCSIALQSCADTPSAVDASAPADASSPSDAGATAADATTLGTNGCTDDRFVDRTTTSVDSRMVMVPYGTFTFDYPCMTIRAGQSVMFMWDFSEYPLEPGAIVAGHPALTDGASPIEPRRSGEQYDVTFSAPGDYPYYSVATYDAGMQGVVRVVP